MSGRPNFLVIVADDLGFSDLGCFGGEIDTPNLDRLAANGQRFTESAMCSPTRSMLLSGTDHHLAGLGAMLEESKMPYGKRWRDQDGYEGYLVDRVAALPEVLQDAGYHTMMSGKWHLGRTLDKIPAARGFTRSFSMLGALHNHYAWEPQFAPGAKYEEYYENWHGPLYGSHNLYARDQGYTEEIIANFPSKTEGFYSTKSFTDELLKFLDERNNDTALQTKPFFGYLAFTAPHYPLQAPKAVREKYRGVYDDGPVALREKRLAKLRSLGLVDEVVKPHELVDIWGKGEWEALDPEERAKSVRTMETYAAMVDVIDQQVGRVIEKLSQKGDLDNTFILFMSDNGAEGASYECIPTMGRSYQEVINRNYDNSLENIGEPNSFAWYGGSWAQASTAPSRLFKCWTSQGGIRVPCILHYPKGVQDRGNSAVADFATCMDIMPTILDLAGVQHPAANGEKFRGRKVIPMTGASWKPWLERSSSTIHDTVAIPQGWELHGCAALRKGDYKILFMPPPGGKATWELFNITEDPGETTDLAQEKPEILEDLLASWEGWRSSNNVIWYGDDPYAEGP